MAQKLKFEEKTIVPNSFYHITIMMLYSFLEYVRSRRFFILLLITIAIGMLLTGVVAYYRPQSFLVSEQSFYANWWGETVTFIIILSAVFFGGDAISGEFQNKTGYFLVGNPIRRSSIYLGKFLAAFCGALIMLLVFTAMTIGNGLYYFGGVTNLFWESLSFSVLYLATAIGMTFFFSSIFKTNSTAIVVTIILMLFVFSLMQSLVANLAHYEPWFIVTYGAQIINNVLMNPYPPSTQTTAAPLPHGQSITVTSYNATVPEGLIIMMGYFIVSLVTGLILFERKEFN